MLLERGGPVEILLIKGASASARRGRAVLLGDEACALERIHGKHRQGLPAVVRLASRFSHCVHFRAEVIDRAAYVTFLVEDHLGVEMFEVLILVCLASVSAPDCQSDTAVNVIRGPVVSSVVACGLQGQALLASTSVGSDLGGAYMMIRWSRAVLAEGDAETTAYKLQ